MEFDLVGQRSDHETNDGTGGNRGEDRIAAVIIMHPVVAIWRFVEAPIIIISDDDRIIVVAIVTANPVARHIVAVIHEPEGWP